MSLFLKVFNFLKDWFHYFLTKKVLKLKFKWNPYLKYPRNVSCYCGSGVKYKKCCLNNEPVAIEAGMADKATKLIKKVRRRYAK